MVMLEVTKLTMTISMEVIFTELKSRKGKGFLKM